MTLNGISTLLNHFLIKRNKIADKDLQANPLIYADYLIAIREELGDECTIATDKAIKEAINTLLKLNAANLKQAIKQHRRMWLRELIRRLSK